MGRTQVERNRRLGRPGVRGGRTVATNDKPRMSRHHDLGDNSFRYQKSDKSSTSDMNQDESEWDYLSSANMYGASHATIHLPSNFDDLDLNKTTDWNLYEVDINKLSSCIDEMKTSSEWMKLDDDRIAKIFDDRFQCMNDEKKTLAEINACHPFITIESQRRRTSKMDEDINELDDLTKVSDQSNLMSEVQETSFSSRIKEGSDSEDVNNLQDWLDEMIEP